MASQELTKTLTVRITPLQKQRLDILTSFAETSPSRIVSDYIDFLWKRHMKSGDIQNYVHRLTYEPKPAEAQAPQAE